jgi:5-(carboxyamino)imidazole ribonucleotide mutase
MTSTKKPIVGVVMGSDSDWSVMSDAAQALKDFGIEYEVEVLSAHRTPEKMIEWGKAAAGRGIKVIIAGAKTRWYGFAAFNRADACRNSSSYGFYRRS